LVKRKKSRGSEKRFSTVKEQQRGGFGRSDKGGAGHIKKEYEKSCWCGLEKTSVNGWKKGKRNSIGTRATHVGQKKEKGVWAMHPQAWRRWKEKGKKDTSSKGMQSRGTKKISGSAGAVEWDHRRAKRRGGVLRGGVVRWTLVNLEKVKTFFHCRDRTALPHEQ